MKKHLFLILLPIPISLFAQGEVNTDDELVKTIYFNDSIPAIVGWYGDDKKRDSLKTYNKSGELDESLYFNNGRYDGVLINSRELCATKKHLSLLKDAF